MRITIDIFIILNNIKYEDNSLSKVFHVQFFEHHIFGAISIAIHVWYCFNVLEDSFYQDKEITSFQNYQTFQLINRNWELFGKTLLNDNLIDINFMVFIYD